MYSILPDMYRPIHNTKFMVTVKEVIRAALKPRMTERLALSISIKNNFCQETTANM